MWKRIEVKECIKIDGFYSMFVESFDKDYNFRGESHDFWECFYVIRGKARVSANERIYNLSRGEIVFHKPLELHKFRVSDDRGLEAFVFSFDMRGECAQFFKNKVFSLSEDQRALIDDFMFFLRSSMPYPSGVRPNYVPLGAKDLYLQTASTFVTSLFLSLLNKQRISEPEKSADAETFKLLVELMKENIASGISTDELAKSAHISKTALKVIFSKYSGMGAHKYFLKMKIARASRLLKKGVCVTDVAAAVGFSSQAYFSSAFKREVGISPLEYARL